MQQELKNKLPSIDNIYSFLLYLLGLSSETVKDIHHVKINIEPQATASPKYYVASTVKFSSLTQLLDFYSQYEIHVQENIKDLKLLYPLVRACVIFHSAFESVALMASKINSPL